MTCEETTAVGASHTDGGFNSKHLVLSDARLLNASGNLGLLEQYSDTECTS
jgi:hypothetical protein